jgi:hypothetical protein
MLNAFIFVRSGAPLDVEWGWGISPAYAHMQHVLHRQLAERIYSTSTQMSKLHADEPANANHKSRRGLGEKRHACTSCIDDVEYHFTSQLESVLYRTYYPPHSATKKKGRRHGARPD